MMHVIEEFKSEHWDEIPASVFVLQHVREEEVKLIGVYSSREKAEGAVTRLSRLPGFSDAQDGFHVDEYPVDQDHWVDGYLTDV